MTILVFGEGNSEENVCNELKKRFEIQLKYEPAKGNRDAINKMVLNRIRPLLQEEESVLCVILYDLDSHENKTEADINASIFGREGWLRKIDIFSEIDFQNIAEQHSSHENLYTLSLSEFKFNLAIHIATKRWKKSFTKSAIDDYVLELALRPNTAAKLAKFINISPDKVIAKITQEIPDLLKANANGQDNLTEAKDYVRLYAAVLKLHTSPAVFAGKTMANADEQDIREIFQPLIAAFEFVGGADAI
ncbi:MAG: hypothetical protein HC769_07200 [Cyanobacteria bacterium CRU_2_1]|nr:hypothetical protein [Cyanobacteria bacterium CRU_2_1]